MSFMHDKSRAKVNFQRRAWSLRRWLYMYEKLRANVSLQSRAWGRQDGNETLAQRTKAKVRLWSKEFEGGSDEVQNPFEAFSNSFKGWFNWADYPQLYISLRFINKILTLILNLSFKKLKMFAPHKKTPIIFFQKFNYTLVCFRLSRSLSLTNSGD